MILFPKRFLPVVLSSLLFACAPAPTDLLAESSGERPFDQLDLARNACGPAALLNAWRFGNPRWRTLAENPPGSTDRERIRSIARGPAMRESSSLPGRARWSRNGINLLDLRDVANEISQPEGLPRIFHETFFLKPAETQQSLLARVHKQIAKSLSSGFPPLLSIRHYEKRGETWQANRGHFVTVTAISRIAGNSFQVKYIDPLGGKFCTGEIRIGNTPFLGEISRRNPNLEAILPETKIGTSSGNQGYIAVAAAIGQF